MIIWFNKISANSSNVKLEMVDKNDLKKAIINFTEYQNLAFGPW